MPMRHCALSLVRAMRNGGDSESDQQTRRIRMRRGRGYQQKLGAAALIRHQAMVDAGIEMYGISAFQPMLLMRKKQPKPALKHIEPLLAFMMIELLEIAAGRQRN